MDAIAIALPWLDSGQIRMPDIRILFGEFDAAFVVLIIEQAEFHPFGHLGEEREVDAGAIVAGS